MPTRQKAGSATGSRSFPVSGITYVNTSRACTPTAKDRHGMDCERTGARQLLGTHVGNGSEEHGDAATAHVSETSSSTRANHAPRAEDIDELGSDDTHGGEERVQGC